MRTSDGVKQLIKDKGLRQAWVVDRMNLVNPDLHMSNAKLSSIVCGGRKMSGDELIAFCVATDTSPDYFSNTARSSA